MSDIPEGVLLLYTLNRLPYTITRYSTTARVFVPDTLINSKRVFVPMAPLLKPKFQVDNTVK